MATIQATSNKLNPFETIKDRYKTSSAYAAMGGDKGWQDATTTQTLDTFAATVMELDRTNQLDSLKQNYNLDVLNNSEKMLAGALQLGWIDNKELNEYTRYATDEETGEYLYNDDGTHQEETYEDTAYNYYNDYLHSIIEQKEYYEELDAIQAAKDARNGFVKFLATCADFFVNLVLDVVDVLQYIGEFIAGTGAAIGDLFDKNSSGSFRKIMSTASVSSVLNGDNAYGQWRRSWVMGYDPVTGQANTLQTVLGSIAKTVAEIIPSIIIGGVGNSKASSLMDAAKATKIAKTTGTISEIVYWTNLGISNVAEYMQNPDYASTPTWAILLSSALEATVDAVIAKAFSSFMGSSVSQRFMFGWDTYSKTAAATLSFKTAAGRIGYRLLHDFVEQGITEVFQEWSTYGVRTLVGLIEPSMRSDDHFTIEQAIQAYYTAGITALISGGFSILATERVSTNIETETKNGTTVFKKYGKFVSFDIKQTTLMMQQAYTMTQNPAKYSAEQQMRAANLMVHAYMVLGQTYNVFQIDGNMLSLLNEVDKKIQEVAQYETEHTSEVEQEALRRAISKQIIDKKTGDVYVAPTTEDEFNAALEQLGIAKATTMLYSALQTAINQYYNNTETSSSKRTHRKRPSTEKGPKTKTTVSKAEERIDQLLLVQQKKSAVQPEETTTTPAETTPATEVTAVPEETKKVTKKKTKTKATSKTDIKTAALEEANVLTTEEISNELDQITKNNDGTYTHIITNDDGTKETIILTEEAEAEFENSVQESMSMSEEELDAEIEALEKELEEGTTPNGNIVTNPKTTDDYVEEIATEAANAKMSQVATTVINENVDNVLNDKNSSPLEVKAAELTDLLDVDQTIVTSDGHGAALIQNEKTGESTAIVSDDLLTAHDTPYVARSIAEHEIIKRIARSTWNTAALKSLADVYAAYKPTKDTIDANVIVTALFFDKDFLEVALNVGNKDAYEMIVHLVEMYNAVKKSSKGDLNTEIFEKRLSDLIKNISEVVYKYIQYNPNYIDVDSVPDGILSKQQKGELKAAMTFREASELVIKYANNPNAEEKFLTGLNVLTKLVQNNGVFTKVEQQRILHALQSTETTERAKQLRVGACRMISRRYQVLFNSLYDDDIYLAETSIGNIRFNQYLQENGWTVNDFRNPTESMFNEDQIQRMNGFSVANAQNFMATTFADCNANKLHVEIEPRSNINSVSEGQLSNVNTRVTIRSSGDNNTNFDYQSLYQNANDVGESILYKNTKRSIEKSAAATKRVSEKRALSGRATQSISQKYTSMWIAKDADPIGKVMCDGDIHELASHPEYLSEDVINQLVSTEYTDVITWMTRQIEETSNGKQSVSFDRQGKAVVVNYDKVLQFLQTTTKLDTDGHSKKVYQADELLKLDEDQKKKTVKVSQLVNPKFLTNHELQSAKVVIRRVGNGDHEGAAYDAETNTIEIYTDAIASLKFVFLHEFIHVIETSNGLNTGAVDDLCQTHYMSEQEFKSLVKSMKEIYGDLYDEIYQSKAEEHGPNIQSEDLRILDEETCDDIMYMVSGEVEANFGTSIDYHHLIVVNSNAMHHVGKIDTTNPNANLHYGCDITLPNGETYFFDYDQRTGRNGFPANRQYLKLWTFKNRTVETSNEMIQKIERHEEKIDYEMRRLNPVSTASPDNTYQAELRKARNLLQDTHEWYEYVPTLLQYYKDPMGTWSNASQEDKVKIVDVFKQRVRDVIPSDGIDVMGIEEYADETIQTFTQTLFAARVLGTTDATKIKNFIEHGAAVFARIQEHGALYNDPALSCCLGYSAIGTENLLMTNNRLTLLPKCTLIVGAVPLKEVLCFFNNPESEGFISTATMKKYSKYIQSYPVSFIANPFDKLLTSSTKDQTLLGDRADLRIIDDDLLDRDTTTRVQLSGSNVIVPFEKFARFGVITRYYNINDPYHLFDTNDAYHEGIMSLRDDIIIVKDGDNENAKYKFIMVSQTTRDSDRRRDLRYSVTNREQFVPDAFEQVGDYGDPQPIYDYAMDMSDGPRSNWSDLTNYFVIDKVSGAVVTNMHIGKNYQGNFEYGIVDNDNHQWHNLDNCEFHLLVEANTQAYSQDNVPDEVKKGLAKRAEREALWKKAEKGLIFTKNDDGSTIATFTSTTDPNSLTIGERKELTNKIEDDELTKLAETITKYPKQKYDTPKFNNSNIKSILDDYTIEELNEMDSQERDKLFEEYNNPDDEDVRYLYQELDINERDIAIHFADQLVGNGFIDYYCALKKIKPDENFYKLYPNQLKSMSHEIDAFLDELRSHDIISNDEYDRLKEQQKIGVHFVTVGELISKSDRKITTDAFTSDTEKQAEKQFYDLQHRCKSLDSVKFDPIILSELSYNDAVKILQNVAYTLINFGTESLVNISQSEKALCAPAIHAYEQYQESRRIIQKYQKVLSNYFSGPMSKETDVSKYNKQQLSKVMFNDYGNTELRDAMQYAMICNCFGFMWPYYMTFDQAKEIEVPLCRLHDINDPLIKDDGTMASFSLLRDEGDMLRLISQYFRHNIAFDREGVWAFFGMVKIKNCAAYDNQVNEIFVRPAAVTSLTPFFLTANNSNKEIVLPDNRYIGKTDSHNIATRFRILPDISSAIDPTKMFKHVIRPTLLDESQRFMPDTDKSMTISEFNKQNGIIALSTSYIPYYDFDQATIDIYHRGILDFGSRSFIEINFIESMQAIQPLETYRIGRASDDRKALFVIDPKTRSGFTQSGFLDMKDLYAVTKDGQILTDIIMEVTHYDLGMYGPSVRDRQTHVRAPLSDVIFKIKDSVSSTYYDINSLRYTTEVQSQLPDASEYGGRYVTLGHGPDQVIYTLSGRLVDVSEYTILALPTDSSDADDPIEFDSGMYSYFEGPSFYIAAPDYRGETEIDGQPIVLLHLQDHYDSDSFQDDWDDTLDLIKKHRDSFVYSELRLYIHNELVKNMTDDEKLEYMFTHSIFGDYDAVFDDLSVYLINPTFISNNTNNEVILSKEDYDLLFDKDTPDSAINSQSNLLPYSRMLTNSDGTNLVITTGALETDYHDTFDQLLNISNYQVSGIIKYHDAIPQYQKPRRITLSSEGLSAFALANASFEIPDGSELTVIYLGDVSNVPSDGNLRDIQDVIRYALENCPEEIIAEDYDSIINDDEFLDKFNNLEEEFILKNVALYLDDVVLISNKTGAEYKPFKINNQYVFARIDKTDVQLAKQVRNMFNVNDTSKVYKPKQKFARKTLKTTKTSKAPKADLIDNETNFYDTTVINDATGKELKTAKDRFLSQKFMEGTNFDAKVSAKGSKNPKFVGYIQPNKRVRVDGRVQALILSSDLERLSTPLSSAIRMGTLNTVWQIYDYIGIANTKNMNQYTFDQINSYFFQNIAIKNVSQLKSLSDVLPQAWAFGSILEDVKKDAQKMFNSDNSEQQQKGEQILKVVDNLETSWRKRKTPHTANTVQSAITQLLDFVDPKYKKKFETQYSTFWYGIKGDFVQELTNLMSEENNKVTLMNYYDGTIGSIVQVANMIRWLAIKASGMTGEKYNVRGVNDNETYDENVVIDTDFKMDSINAQKMFADMIAKESLSSQAGLVTDYLFQKNYEAGQYEGLNDYDLRRAYYDLKIQIQDSASKTNQQFQDWFVEAKAFQAKGKMNKDLFHNIKFQSSYKVPGERPNSAIVAHIKGMMSSRGKHNIYALTNITSAKQLADKYRSIFEIDPNDRSKVILRPEAYSASYTDRDGNTRMLPKDTYRQKIIGLERTMEAVIEYLELGMFNNAAKAKKAVSAIEARVALKTEKEVHQKQDKEIYNLKKELSKFQGYSDDGTPYNINVYSDRPMPEAIKTLLSTGFKSEVFKKREVQNLTEENEMNIQMSIDQFFTDVLPEFVTFTDVDTDEIINYLCDANIVIESDDINAKRRYDAYKMFLLTYYEQENMKGNIILDSDTELKLRVAMKSMISSGATVMAIWRRVVNRLNPTKLMVQQLYKRYGLEYDEIEVNALVDSLNVVPARGDPKDPNDLSQGYKDPFELADTGYLIGSNERGYALNTNKSYTIFNTNRYHKVLGIFEEIYDDATKKNATAETGPYLRVMNGVKVRMTRDERVTEEPLSAAEKQYIERYRKAANWTKKNMGNVDEVYEPQYDESGNIKRTKDGEYDLAKLKRPKRFESDFDKVRWTEPMEYNDWPKLFTQKDQDAIDEWSRAIEWTRKHKLIAMMQHTAKDPGAAYLPVLDSDGHEIKNKNGDIQLRRVYRPAAADKRVYFVMDDENKAIMVGNIVEIIEERLLNQIKENPNSLIERIVSWEGVSMLCWPGTMIRNRVSNVLVRWSSKLSDQIGRVVGIKGLFKHRMEAYHEYIDEYNATQDALTAEGKKATRKIFPYKIVGTKVSEEMNNAVNGWMNATVYIDSNGKPVRNMDAIGSEMSKFVDKPARSIERRVPGKQPVTVNNLDKDRSKVTHVRGSKLEEENPGYSLASQQAQMIIEAITNRLLNRHKFDSKGDSKVSEAVAKGANAFSAFVYKLLSDKWDMNRDFKKYFGIVLTERGIKPEDVNLNNKEVMAIAADTYAYIAWKYMHRGSVLAKLEQEIKKKGTGLWAVYKQFFYFGNATWNWFLSMLKLTPVGLCQAIYRICHMEQETEKAQKRYEERQGPGPDWVEYEVKQDFGKGVLGTVLFALGCLLGAFGVIAIDDEDNKLKIRFGDNVYMDISALYGTSSLLAGAALTYSIFCADSGTNVADALVTAVDSMFSCLLEDSIITTFYNSFRYATSAGNWLTSEVTAILSMMVPNVMKKFSSLLYTFEPQYSNNEWAKAFEKMFVQCVPFAAYAFPREIDPFTGNVKSTYYAAFWTKLWNAVSPIDIYPYKRSAAEQEARRLGLNKSQLTGNYDDIGKLTKKQVQALNEMYGQLNYTELTKFMNNKTSYKVQDENGNYVELKYSQMTDEQRANVFNRIMSNNSTYSKIYVYTDILGGKYYATEELYQTLKSLGIKTRIYKETTKKSGFM